ncbi:MAG: glycosyltransferase family 39 protein [Chloroflexi bacterium]|nr:glycosyltransferase family 39 protein [Chloroflexota bacterium]
MVKISQLKQPFLGRNLLLFLLLFLALIIPRLLVLKQTITIDEPKWSIRSANFGYAIEHQDFASTNQRGHPGVTIMWAGQMGLKLLFPEYNDLSKQNINAREFKEIVQQNGYHFVNIFAGQRAMVVLMNSVTLLIAFAYSKKLLGTLTSIVGFLLIAFSPFMAAHTKLMQLDGPSASFILLSLLAFLNYLKSQRRSALFVSGIVAGLAWLSRSPTLALIPAIGLILLLHMYQQVRNQNQAAKKMLSQTFVLFFIWLSLGIVTFVILWPAMWVSPMTALASVYGNIFKGTVTGHPRSDFFAGKLTEPGITHLPPYYYPVAYLWRSTPIVIMGLILSFISFWKKSRPYKEQFARNTVWAFLIFAIIFTSVMALSNKKQDRYLLPIYGPLMLIAAGGWVAFAYWIKQKLPVSEKYKYSGISLLILIVLLQILSLVQVFPYYLSHYNIMLGGSEKAPEVMQIGWGEGLDAAARYLNEKNDASTLRVATWYASSFAYFFDGQTISISGNMNDTAKQEIFNADYIVIYIHQWQRQLPKSLLNELESVQPEHTIWINRIPYVQIYKNPEREN